MARLHIYPHSEPQHDLHIVADPAALRALAEALTSVARNPNSFERVKLHTSDGHEYTAMIVSGVGEDEWQNIPPAYAESNVPAISTLEDYHSLKKQLTETQQKL
jgi:hypothetical protein